MHLPTEIWHIIFQNVWPIDMINIRLACTHFNNIIMSQGFINSWVHSKYYKDLIGEIHSDIYKTYDEYLSLSYDYYSESCDPIELILLAKTVRYGDIKSTNKLIDKHHTLIDNHIADWLLECSIRSNCLKMIKLINDKFKSIICAWRYGLIESIDTDNLEIIKYMSIKCGYNNRVFGFAHAIRNKKYDSAKLILKHGINHNNVYSHFSDITPKILNDLSI